MNTNNVMAMAVQPASSKVATNAKQIGTKSSNKTNTKANSGAFDDVLDKASTDFANTKDIQKASVSQNDDTTLDNGQSEKQTTSADLLAMWLAANSTPSDQVADEVAAPTSEVETAAVNVQLSTEAQADMVELPVNDTKVTANLQSVLPQDNKVLQQNSNFLAMLSGQQVKTAATTELVKQTAIDSVTTTNSETVANQSMTDILSAQLANSANKANAFMAAVNANKETTVVMEPIAQATAETAQQTVDISQTANAKANEQTSLMTNNTLLASDLAALNANSKLNLTMAESMTKVNQPAEAMTNDISLSELIDSSQLTIVEETAAQVEVPQVMATISEQTAVETKSNANGSEKNVATSTNNSNNQLTATSTAILQQQSVMTDDSAMNNGQSQQQQPHQSANNNATAAVLANLADDVEAMTELPEEAVGDRVLTKSTATTENTTTTSNSASISVFQQDLQDSLTGATKTNQATTNQATTDYDIPKQIVDQARLIRRAENTEMVIKLNPEHLGELTLKVSVTSNGSVNASFHSDNAQVRTIIENSLVNLRQELNNQGLKVDNVDVYAGLADGQLPQGEGQQAWQQQQSQQGQANVRVNMTADDYLDEVAEVAAPATTATTSSSDGVDYRI